MWSNNKIYLEDIEKYSKIVSDLDRTEMRKYSQIWKFGIEELT